MKLFAVELVYPEPNAVARAAVAPMLSPKANAAFAEAVVVPALARPPANDPCPEETIPLA
jgi:hypothetical protein